MNNLSLADAAARYAALGIRVLPVCGIDASGRPTCGWSRCPAPGKHPLISNWPVAASADVHTVQGWWRRFPDANIGLICGEQFDVLDIDNGDDGWRLLEAAARRSGYGSTFERTWTVSTGRGTHTYFATFGQNMKQLISSSIQVVSTSHYVLAPPSRHASGRIYTLRDGLEDVLDGLPPVPDWLHVELVDLDELAEASRRFAADIPDDLEDDVPELDPDSMRRYGAAALRSAFETVRTAREGTRNNTFNKEVWCILRLVPDVLDLDVVMMVMFEAGLACGLSEKEISDTFASAFYARFGSRTRPNVRR